MRVFIRNSILFSTLFLFITVIAQLFVNYRIKDITLSGHDNLKLTQNINADLVFLGSSRCWVHFDPRFFDSVLELKTVNIGVNGHLEFSMIELRLKNYLSNNIPPHYAVLSLDPFVTLGDQAHSPNLTHKNDFARYAWFPDEQEMKFVNYFHFSLAEKYVPLYALVEYNLLANCIFPPGNVSWAKRGYEAHPERWDTVANPVTNAAEKSYVTDAGLEQLKDSLKSLQNFCSNLGITLIAVQTPVYKAIYRRDRFEKTAWLAAYCNIPFIETNDSGIGENINFFYNPNHMNTAGVDSMNRYLINKTGFLKLFSGPAGTMHHN